MTAEQVDTDRPTIWVCAGCGKTGATRETIGDEDCYIHGNLVYADSIVRGSHGRIIGALAAEGNADLRAQMVRP